MSQNAKAVAGESAGATLAACVVQACRQNGPRIAVQLWRIRRPTLPTTTDQRMRTVMRVDDR
jgi:acetyl esterase/lipase